VRRDCGGDPDRKKGPIEEGDRYVKVERSRKDQKDNRSNRERRCLRALRDEKTFMTLPFLGKPPQ